MPRLLQTNPDDHTHPPVTLQLATMMDSLEQVNEALEKVVAFLAPLVPLIGCHMVDFLTLRHWDALLPPQLQQDLLSLPSETLHLLPSAALPRAPGKGY